METATGHRFAPEELDALAKGPDEVDLVNSGLEETMVQAYHSIREIKHQYNRSIDLRPASFIDAIDKIAMCDGDMGIFPSLRAGVVR